MTGETEKPEVQEIGPKSTFSDELTPAEKAYFESGGKDLSGLLNDDIYKNEAAQHREEFERPQNEEPVHHHQEELSARGEETPPVKAPTSEAPPPKTEEVVPDDEEINFDEITYDSAGKPRDKQGRFVPHSALVKERERFKEKRDQAARQATELEELRARNQELQESQTRVSERMNLLQELFEKNQRGEATETPAAPPQEETPPDPETDIFAYVRWQDKRFQQLQEAHNKQIQELSEKLTNSTSTINQQLTEQQMIDTYRSDAARFAREKADFGEAYKHLVGQRHAQLALMGFNDANKRMEQIRNEERQLLELAFQQGRRPAEYIYNYAVTMGYNPAQSSPPPTQPTPVAPSAPQAAAPVTNPAPTPPIGTPPAAAPNGQLSEAERLLQQRNAQNASATLSGSGGQSSEGLTAEKLAQMSEAEFQQIYAKLGRDGMRQFLGGAV